MLLENLHLENFKNYKSCSFSFNPRLNFIFGENGNGKTNILEAISFLCYGKSFLLNSEQDCVKYEESFFDIKGGFRNHAEISNKVRFTFQKETNLKSIHRDSEKIEKLNEFIGLFPLVVLSPQDLKLTSGIPHDRRRNFDLLISQISSLYLDDLRKYSKIIRQKNTLLKENLIFKKYSNGELKAQVEVWNEELINFAVKILLRRLDFIEGFKQYLESSFKQIVGDKYIPVIEYESDIIDISGEELHDVAAIKEKFTSALSGKLDAEIKRGISLAGPHRDNYIFKMKKSGQLFDMRTFASQGEHKLFTVSLKLSEFDYIKSNLEHTTIGEPILLLDDVFSELDKSKIKKISSLITGYNQVFLTTTDFDYLNILKENFSDINAYHIINGTAALAG